MRTPTVVCLSALASAAIAVPTAIAAHDYLENSGLNNNSVLRLPSPLHSNNQPSQGNAGPGQPQTGPKGQTTSSRSGTETRATRSQEQGVVMIDTVLPGGEGAGSGMVVSADGTVLTNYHVVNGSSQIRVKVPHGAVYTADVVGHDQSHDVAVLKLRHASGLKTVTLDSESARVAESVLAVGQGDGEGVLFAARGVVASTDARITATNNSALASRETLTGLLQTNAPIVPGYSGGPLFDSSGKVVGINTAASASNSLAGYDNPQRNSQIEGFAIPITQAKSIMSDILAGKKTASNHIGARASLGIKVLPSSASASERGRRSEPSTVQGVTVQGVLPGQGANKAGLGEGDVITSIAGHRISNSSDLSRVMDTQYPGTQVKVSWTSPDGANHSAKITLSQSSVN